MYYTVYIVNTPHNVLIAAAGTAGHIVPALAVAKALEEFGYAPIFLGSTGIETELVPQAGYELKQIPKLPFERDIKHFYKNLRLPFALNNAIEKVVKIIHDTDIKSVVVFGGYISVPAIYAAKKCGIPLIVHEQNTKVGLANKLATKSSAFFGYSFPNTQLPNALSAQKDGENRAKYVGLPLRREVLELALESRKTPEKVPNTATKSTKPAKSPAKTQKLLVFGGSLGAQSINQAIQSLLAQSPEILQSWQITHITGKGKSEAALELRKTLKPKRNYVVQEYTDDLPELINSADLVVSRSGAATVHELAALAKPAILVPLPIGNGEQKLNASLLGEGGEVINDKDLSPEVLLKLLNDYNKHPEKLTEMSVVAGKNAILDATETFAHIIDTITIRSSLIQYQKSHFMAISGAGIAPIATCFEQFSTVTGCDSIGDGHSPEHLPGQDLMVYSSAIKPLNLEYKAARNLETEGKIAVLHRSQALDKLLRIHNHAITVAGSHGKTTITAMIAQVFEKMMPQNSSYVIGALTTINDKPTNGGKLAQNYDYIVAEADESDGSFQKYHPEIAIISNIEADHLDYYGDYEGVKQAFLNYARHAKHIVTTTETAKTLKLTENLPLGKYVYSITQDEIKSANYEINMPGVYNQINALLASKALEIYGITPEQTSVSLTGFRGADRRFEMHEIGDYLVIDDYAHHPTEVANLIAGATQKFGNNQFVLLFQPHLYSRTRDFATEFAKALKKVKRPIVTQIYKAREEQVDFPDVLPETIGDLARNIKTTDTIDAGVALALEFADELPLYDGKKVILSVGAGPSLIDDFKQQIAQKRSR